MSKKGIRADLLTLLAVLLAVCSQKSLASVKIFNPAELKEKASNETGILDAGLANFGHFDYGSSIVSSLTL